MGPEVTLINPAADTARQVKQMLTEKDMLRENKDVGVYQYYLSDFSQSFKQIGSNFLNKNIEYAEKIDIENY